MDKETRLNLRISVELRKQIEKAAEQNKRNMSNMALIILEENVSKYLK
ncbi:MAG: Arc family DNA-binding protein [PVC group bacterium]|nr:Arc family DNA-binding protein [PVC group bacterium]